MTKSGRPHRVGSTSSSSAEAVAGTANRVSNGLRQPRINADQAAFGLPADPESGAALCGMVVRDDALGGDEEAGAGRS